MEPWQAETVAKITRGKYPISLLGLWASSQRPYIHDPYNLSSIYFIKCFKYIEKSVYDIAKKNNKF